MVDETVIYYKSKPYIYSNPDIKQNMFRTLQAVRQIWFSQNIVDENI